MEEPQDKPTTPTTQVPQLSLPPTSSLTILQDGDTDIQDTQDTEAQDSRAQHEIDDDDTQQSLGPQPLAIKPVYKKRVVVSSRPDGIIRRSGAQAAAEKQMVETQRSNRPWRSKISVYEDIQDPALSVGGSDSSMSVQEQDSPLASPTKRKVPYESKPRIRKRPRPPPIIWKPKPKDGEAPPSRSSKSSSIRFDREAYMNTMLRHQALYKERIAQLTSRPLPLRDLQTLIQADLEQEDLALTELGIKLYREYLKLQLEEGVLMNMLHYTKAEVLDTADLEKVKPPRKYTKRQPRSPGASKTSTRASSMGSPTPSTSVATSTVGSPSGVSYLESMDIEMEERNVEGEDEGDGDDGGSDSDGYETSQLFQAPGESYSMPSIGPSSPVQAVDTVGRPEASVRSLHGPDDGHKKLTTQSSTQDTQETGDHFEQDPMNADNGDLFGSEDDDSEADIAYSGGEESEDSEDSDTAAREALKRMLAEFGPPI
ncbi:hypothetical protein BGX34_004341 [Mortierella sp. NVP85]|nr:hypothetical protein BGX34_004341 [Mortierella sp. NVP85]